MIFSFFGDKSHKIVLKNDKNNVIFCKPCYNTNVKNISYIRGQNEKNIIY